MALTIFYFFFFFFYNILFLFLKGLFKTSGGTHTLMWYACMVYAKSRKSLGKLEDDQKRRKGFHKQVGIKSMQASGIMRREGYYRLGGFLR